MAAKVAPFGVYCDGFVLPKFEREIMYLQEESLLPKVSSDKLEVTRIISILTNVIGKASLLQFGDSKVGGRFTLLLKNIGFKPLLETKIGKLSEADNLILQGSSLENAVWLHNNPKYFTSYDFRFDQPDFHPAVSMNFMPGGGAVSSNSYIFSFSGFCFPELWNEAAMLVTAYYLWQLNDEDVTIKIASRRNPNCRPLLESCL